MAVHPQAQTVLDTMAAAGISLDAFDNMTAPQAREMMAAMRVPLEPEPVAKVENRTVPGAAGEIPVRIYTPEGTNLPALVWFHGGGWVIGDLDGADPTCRSLANKVGCVVVSVDYHMAPEFKFPVPAEDCYTVTKWVADNAASLGVDASRIAVGGDSAGGNLAAVVSIMAKERGGPGIAFQLLVYPVTDYNFETSSYVSNANGYMLTIGSMRWFWGHYLNDASEGGHRHASPLQAPDLTGLPPALVITAEYDPLMSEGEAYAAKLKEAGVKVTQTRYDGMIHGFFGMAAAMDSAKEAVAQAASELKAAFAG
ncbi:lipase [bacterium SCGC AG-212-C10]|nr:lipase [bacterium SCGC AG-212-C10]